MMTGFTPYSSALACGVLPKFTYAQAKASTMSMAGRMNNPPAITSPSLPARV